MSPGCRQAQSPSFPSALPLVCPWLVPLLVLNWYKPVDNFLPCFAWVFHIIVLAHLCHVSAPQNWGAKSTWHGQRLRWMMVSQRLCFMPVVLPNPVTCLGSPSLEDVEQEVLRGDAEEGWHAKRWTRNSVSCSHGESCLNGQCDWADGYMLQGKQWVFSVIQNESRSGK